MYYLCIENDELVSVLDYLPNVPETVKVLSITEDKKRLLDSRTHYFDPKTMKITPYPKQTTIETKP